MAGMHLADALVYFLTYFHICTAPMCSLFVTGALQILHDDDDDDDDDKHRTCLQPPNECILAYQGSQ